MAVILFVWIIACYIVAVVIALDMSDNDKEMSRAELALTLLAPVSIPIVILQVLFNNR